MRVRTHLSLLAAAVFLPVILGSAIAIKFLLDAERQAVLRSMQELARATVLSMDQEIRAAMASAQVLSTSALLARGDLEGFYGQALAANAGSVRQTALLRPDGQQILSTYLPFGAAIPAPSSTARERVRIALAGGRPSVSNLLVGAASHKYVVAVEQPATLAGGRRILVNQWIYAADLNRLLSTDIPSGWVVSVFDREGRTIARSRNWERDVGGHPAHVLLEALQSGRASATGVSRDGVSMYAALVRSPLTGWTATVGVPTAELTASTARAVALTAATLLCAVALAVLGAFLFARRLLRATEYLGAATEGMAEGWLPPPADLRITELNALQKVLHTGSTRLIKLETARKRHLAEAQAARRVAESQNRAKDEFLAMLGHELRNPLGAISSAIALIQMGAGGAGAKQAHQIIGRQAKHLAHLVDELLDANRVLSGRLSISQVPLDLAAAVREVVMTQQAQGVTAEHSVELDLAPVWVNSDPTRLQQIIGNLVENAAKYTPAGGHIRVKVAARGDMAELVVADDGKGIEAELLPRVWDVFVQGKVVNRAKGGLGIGLAVVKSLVEQQKGTVEVASRGAQLGSTFTIRLPLANAASAPALAAAEVAPEVPPLNSRRVLVVEDNADLREMMCALLASRGCTVAGAADGRTAITLARQSPPEVAFVDIDLPDISGYEVARALGASGEGASGGLSGIRLVALTGYGQPEDVRQALAAGFERHLKKPVRLEELEQALLDNAPATQS